jgi:hypothetical protein
VTDRPPAALTVDVAAAFARLALANIAREYPTKLDHVLNGDADRARPSALHPVFWGSFDWHSCVHSHWMLARLLRLFPDADFARAIVAHFDARLTPANVAGELAYLDAPNRNSFVRTYGWAWLLKLAEELAAGARDGAVAPDFARWQDALAPLAARFVAMWLEYLPRARVPLRYGIHPNSAFGLAFALDYAAAAGDARLYEACREKALDWFAADVDYPARFEPSGSDFLSPALVEADLMRRVLDSHAFGAWLARFLPDLGAAKPATLFAPVAAGDHTDPQMVHLDGLNLSRAWCFAGIAAALGASDPRHAVLRSATDAHSTAGLPAVLSGDYMGEHWLATVAVHAFAFHADASGLA